MIIVPHANKLVDIGDGRDTALKQGKSKYLEKISPIRKEDIVDLGDSKFMAESENSKNTFYTCDMLSGYCSCPMGSTCAPCKHKSSVAKHFKIALFSVAPSRVIQR